MYERKQDGPERGLLKMTGESGILSPTLITIQLDTKWDRHTNKVVTKTNKTLGFQRRNLKMVAVQTKELAYKSLVRPTLERASTVWNPITQQHASSSITAATLQVLVRCCSP